MGREQGEDGEVNNPITNNQSPKITTDFDCCDIIRDCCIHLAKIEV
jgi:hypothetical protein